MLGEEGERNGRLCHAWRWKKSLGRTRHKWEDNSKIDIK
jgi:hypothetical protein